MLVSGNNSFMAHIPACIQMAHVGLEQCHNIRRHLSIILINMHLESSKNKHKCISASTNTTDLIHKSQNAPVPYLTILHSEQKCRYICSEWSTVGYGTSAFWDLWNQSILLSMGMHGLLKGTRTQNTIFNIKYQHVSMNFITVCWDWLCSINCYQNGKSLTVLSAMEFWECMPFSWKE